MKVTAWEKSWPNLHETLQEEWTYEQHRKKERERPYYIYTVLTIGNHVDKKTPGYYEKIEVVDEFGWIAYVKRLIPKPRYLYDVKYLNIPQEERVILDERTVKAQTAKAASGKYDEVVLYLHRLSKKEADEWLMKENYPYNYV